jgi:CTP:molybdopterin cytidylyltransferase MocA
MLGDETLLERSIRIATEVPCSPIVVVLGAGADLIREHSRWSGAQAIFNPDWKEGMASSIRAGIHALPETDGAILMVCDMPAVTPKHLRELAGSGERTATGYAGRNGVPAYVPRSMFSALKNLQGDQGARGLLQDSRSIQLAQADMDIDTEEDLSRAQELFGEFR